MRQLKRFCDKKSNYRFSDLFGLSYDDIDKHGICLYHGIRFDAINRLESIFKTGYILPSNEIERSFISYDGTTKYLYINNDSDENCNMGKYISVMPYEDSLEYIVFVKENIFFAIKGSVDAIKTTHVSYDEYCHIKDKSDKYYSYAFNEYFVKKGISLNDVLYVGIDSRYYRGDFDKTVEDIIKLMDYYKIDIPFIDEKTNSEIYRLASKKLIKNYNTKCCIDNNVNKG